MNYCLWVATLCKFVCLSQAAGEEALAVGYVMKPSREEDFAKVILSGNKLQKIF